MKMTNRELIVLAIMVSGTNIVSAKDYIKTPIKIKTIDLYRKVGGNEQWTIKSLKMPVNSIGHDQKTYGTTKIKRDTTGLNTRKLKFPTNTTWYLSVDRGNGSPVETKFEQGDKTKDIRIDSVLVLSPGGTATVVPRSRLNDAITR